MSAGSGLAGKFQLFFCNSTRKRDITYFSQLYILLSTEYSLESHGIFKEYNQTM